LKKELCIANVLIVENNSRRQFYAGDIMGKMSQLAAMLDDGASAKQIADWIFSLKVQRGENINETTYDKCMEAAKMWVRQDEAKRNVREGME
jgi:hypothetical protein